MEYKVISNGPPDYRRPREPLGWWKTVFAVAAGVLLAGLISGLIAIFYVGSVVNSINQDTSSITTP